MVATPISMNSLEYGNLSELYKNKTSSVSKLKSFIQITTDPQTLHSVKDLNEHLDKIIHDIEQYELNNYEIGILQENIKNFTSTQSQICGFLDEIYNLVGKDHEISVDDDNMIGLMAEMQKAQKKVVDIIEMLDFHLECAISLDEISSGKVISLNGVSEIMNFFNKSI